MRHKTVVGSSAMDMLGGSCRRWHSVWDERQSQPSVGRRPPGPRASVGQGPGSPHPGSLSKSKHVQRELRAEERRPQVTSLRPAASEILVLTAGLLRPLTSQQACPHHPWLPALRPACWDPPGRGGPRASPQPCAPSVRGRWAPHRAGHRPPSSSVGAASARGALYLQEESRVLGHAREGGRPGNSLGLVD